MDSQPRSAQPYMTTMEIAERLNAIEERLASLQSRVQALEAHGSQGTQHDTSCLDAVCTLEYGHVPPHSYQRGG